MSDPTPSLTLAAALARAGAALIKSAGAATECHMTGRDVRQTYIEDTYRAINDAREALTSYRLAQIKTADERLAAAE